jgi:flotillin
VNFLLVLPFVIVAVVIALIFVILPLMYRRVVPTNMVHIVQSKSKTTPYGSGKDAGNVYYAWPASWPIIGVTMIQLPESVFDIGLNDYDAYDVGRLPFMVDIKAFFRIKDSAKAAQRVASFGELKTQLQAILQGVVRRILSTNKLEEIMQERSGLSVEFTKEVDDQLAELGVCTAKCIEFMDIRDAKGSVVIANMMAKEQSRIEKESRVSVAENQRAAKQAEIEAKRATDMAAQEAAQQVGIRQAEVERETGIAKEKAHQEVQSQAKVTAEREMEVESVKQNRKATIDKEVSITRADAQREVAVRNADAEKEVRIRNANAEKESQTLIAEGHLSATLKDAEGKRAVGLAEADAETAKQLAPVKAQVELAEKIGGNKDYQDYMIRVETVRKEQAVGVAMAASLEKADLKVIANGGSIQEGTSSLMNILSPTGGTSIAGMLAGLAQTEEGAALLKKVTG